MMLRRQIISAALIFIIFLTGALAHAQQPKKFYRIGYLSNTTPTAESPRSEAVGKHLREIGYIEGQNLSIDYRYGEGNSDRVPKLAAELVALNCDAIVVFGGPIWIQAVMDRTKTIPIVMWAGGLDPVDAGLIKSLAHPGGNVTGVINLGADLAGKRLEIFKEALSKLTRLAVLYEPGTAANERLV